MTRFDHFRQSFYIDEGGVPFVHVVDIGLYLQSLEQFDATDAEKHLLAQSVFPITSVQTRRNAPIPLAVHINICIQQIERNAPYGYTPNGCIYGSLTHRHRYGERFALIRLHFSKGQIVKVLHFVGGNLLAVFVNSLRKVTLSVE